MGNKKPKRSKQEYPALDPKYNLKSRRDVLDNKYYINGVHADGKRVIRPLNKEEKQFLNDFNKEYYNASFSSKYGYNDVHECKVDKETIDDIKAQIRDVKTLRKRIWNKSPNTTTEEDREEAAELTRQINEMEDFLDEVHPRRMCERANNKRNYDFMTMAKASNEYDLVSIETITDNELPMEKIEEIYFSYRPKKEDGD